LFIDYPTVGDEVAYGNIAGAKLASPKLNKYLL